jgi:hypothetical protein
MSDFPRLLRRTFIATIMLIALTMPLSAVHLLTRTADIPSLAIDAGPFYVAGFQAQLPNCSLIADCEPIVTGKARRVYEVWLFTRAGAAFSIEPRVDRLLQLELRN